MSLATLSAAPRRAVFSALTLGALLACRDDAEPLRHVAVATVTVSPTVTSVLVGETTRLSALLKDGEGADVTGRTVTWSSSDRGVAAVSGTGVVTGITTGTATIRATSGGRSGSAQVTVAAAPVASLALTPAEAEVVVGRSTQLTARGADAEGKDAPTGIIIWSSSDIAVATVNWSGVVTGHAPGTATISASTGSVTATAVVTVRAPLLFVTVSPSSATIDVGEKLQLTATAKDEHGNSVTGAPITWSSNNQFLASVDSNGLVTGRVKRALVTITAAAPTGKGAASIYVAELDVWDVIQGDWRLVQWKGGKAVPGLMHVDTVTHVYSGTIYIRQKFVTSGGLTFYRTASSSGTSVIGCRYSETGYYRWSTTNREAPETFDQPFTESNDNVELFPSYYDPSLNLKIRVQCVVGGQKPSEAAVARSSIVLHFDSGWVFAR